MAGEMKGVEFLVLNTNSIVFGTNRAQLMFLTHLQTSPTSKALKREQQDYNSQRTRTHSIYVDPYLDHIFSN